MKHMMKLATCAAFLGAAVSAFGSEIIEISPKSKTANLQIVVEELSSKEKLAEAFSQAFEVGSKELKQNGISIDFMCGQHEPSIEIVKQNMPLDFDLTSEKNQNLIQLTHYLWKFQELKNSCLNALMMPNFIEVPRPWASTDDQYVIEVMFPRASRSHIKVVGKFFPGYPYVHGYSLSGYFLFSKDPDSKSIDQILAMSGPIEISCEKIVDGGDMTSKKCLFWQEVSIDELGLDNTITIDTFKETTPFPQKFLDDRQLFEYLFDSMAKYLKFSDPSYSNQDWEDKNRFLNIINTYCGKAKSFRLDGFDPHTNKYTPNDFIDDELKRQEELSISNLKAKYFQRELENETQKFQMALNNKDFTQQLETMLQTKLKFAIIKEQAMVYALENCTRAASIKADKNRQYEENFEEMQNLQVALKCLSGFYGKAIEEKLVENQKILENTFSSFLGGKQ